MTPARRDLDAGAGAYLAAKPRCAVRGCGDGASLVIAGERLCSRHAGPVLRDPDALRCACGCRDEQQRDGRCRECYGRAARIEASHEEVGRCC